MHLLNLNGHCILWSFSFLWGNTCKNDFPLLFERNRDCLPSLSSSTVAEIPPFVRTLLFPYVGILIGDLAPKSVPVHCRVLPRSLSSFRSPFAVVSSWCLGIFLWLQSGILCPIHVELLCGFGLLIWALIHPLLVPIVLNWQGGSDLHLQYFDFELFSCLYLICCCVIHLKLMILSTNWYLSLKWLLWLLKLVLLI